MIVRLISEKYAKYHFADTTSYGSIFCIWTYLIIVLVPFFLSFNTSGKKNLKNFIQIFKFFKEFWKIITTYDDQILITNSQYIIIDVLTITNKEYFYTNINEILDNDENNLPGPFIQFGGEDYDNDTIIDHFNGKVSFLGNSSNIKSIDIFFFIGAKMNVCNSQCCLKIKIF